MGSINIDNTGSGGGVTLSSDGTDLLLDGSAIGGGGGGGADLYAANESSPSAQPSATGANAVAIGDSAVASGADALAFGDGATSSSTRSTAIGYNPTASGINSVAIGPNANSSNFYTVAIGSPSNGAGSVATSAFSAIAINGYASGTDSLAAAIANNTSSYGASGANSIAMGQQAKADGGSGVAIGSSFTRASGSLSLALSRDSHASGTRSVAIGGGEAQAESSFALGLNAKTEVYGKFAYASSRFSAVGDAQGGQFILRADTTDATATVLTTNNSTAASTNQIVAASDTCITFDGTITAMQNGAQAYASWKIEGLLVNDGGTTTLANSATTVIQNSSGWGMALSADNTNNALAITCTGEAAHNILWVANIRTTEVTYA
jgi:hypothetical protein